MQALAVLTRGPLGVLGQSLGTLQASLGQLVVGGQADLCIFEPQGSWRVEPAALLSQGHHTPFEGHELPVRVRTTLVGGQIAHDSASNAAAAKV